MAEESYDEDDDAGEDEYGDEEIYERPGWLREMPYWAISAVLHLILVLILVGIVVYFGCCLLLHIEETHRLFRRLKG